MLFRTRNQVNTKKKSTSKIAEVLSPKAKKTSSSQFGTIFGQNLWDLFVLTGPFSSDHSALKS